MAALYQTNARSTARRQHSGMDTMSCKAFGIAIVGIPDELEPGQEQEADSSPVMHSPRATSRAARNGVSASKRKGGADGAQRLHRSSGSTPHTHHTPSTPPLVKR
jgi:hypothetical protein